MAWLKGIRHRIKRINSVSTPLGGVGWDNPALDPKSSSSPVMSAPEFSATFTPAYSRSRKSDSADELTCIWTGKLCLTNVSPHDAFKVTVQVDSRMDIERPPVVLNSGDSTTIEVQCCRSFDRREIFPSQYQQPFAESQQHDVDPLRERCPSEFTELRLTLTYTNADGIQFTQSMQRDNEKTDMKAEQARCTTISNSGDAV